MAGNGSGATAGSAAQRLETELKRAIVGLELRPGTRLSESEIADRHGVSRQPAREALIALSRMRLVEVLPQRGTVVTKISVGRLMQARFVREAVETAVVRRACDAFDRDARERIDGFIDVQERFASAGDHDSFQRYDELFHIALAEGAGCPLAWEVVRDIKTHMDRLCQLTLFDAPAMLALVEQHRTIIRAIDAGDPDGAAEAMRQHLTEILRAMPRVEAENPELFE
ncbi:GntR family transcriptional regulator [Enterovirga aerilata]|uniref:GntR family transcriptional regulator n=1 Tax=Enterovirga aerilata TaxID=2730920 RepID=A0A849I1W8_9HYPH|nr:GntR family transcriptional regulator [Enterovirga sp. DB1703]NNM73362.1 GntR family transcriptional regulator [Enterovirga sp. DB1703]